MSRHPRDCYITPPCAAKVARALVEILPKRSAYLDPFAGPGLLLEHASPEGAERYAYEIDAMWSPELAKRNVVHTIRDAFDVDWPDMPIVTNVPYGLMESALMRIEAHVHRFRTFALLLNRTDYFQHADRIQPESLTLLKWRPMFGYQFDHRTKRPRMGSDYAGYTWAGLGHGFDRLRLCWMHRPHVSAAEKAEHRRLAMMAFEAANLDTAEKDAA